MFSCIADSYRTPHVESCTLPSIWNTLVISDAMSSILGIGNTFLRLMGVPGHTFRASERFTCYIYDDSLHDAGNLAEHSNLSYV